MNAKQLIAALQKIHPDFQDQDMVVMGMNEKGEKTFELLAGAGVAIAGEMSFAVLTTEAVVRETVKDGVLADYSTNKKITEEDLKNKTNNET